jgi:16S rRNA pseudouridine516 synthase
MASIRLDKLLAQSGDRTRSEAAKLIRAGHVGVDDTHITNPAYKADTERSIVTLDGQRIQDTKYQYVMLHKPAGVLTAARDRKALTVMDLVPEALQARNVMPVGRLDKDTTGLLLLTSDGVLAHRLLAPGTHVWKEYRVTVDGVLTQVHIDAFTQGMPLRDFTAKPAELRIESASLDESQAVVRLREGKYHQIKRMFAEQGLKVTVLHRQAFGPLRLDIPQGEYRMLNNREIRELYAAVQMEWEGRHG